MPVLLWRMWMCECTVPAHEDWTHSENVHRRRKRNLLSCFYGNPAGYEDGRKRPKVEIATGKPYVKRTLCFQSLSFRPWWLRKPLSIFIFGSPRGAGNSIISGNCDDSLGREKEDQSTEERGNLNSIWGSELLALPLSTVQHAGAGALNISNVCKTYANKKGYDWCWNKLGRRRQKPLSSLCKTNYSAEVSQDCSDSLKNNIHTKKRENIFIVHYIRTLYMPIIAFTTRNTEWNIDISVDI